MNLQDYDPEDVRGGMVLVTVIFVAWIILALAGIAAGFVAAVDMAARSIAP